jgi:hypothetical protein
MTVIGKGRLPGGRVQRRGTQDAVLVQAESDASRRLAAEDQFDEVLSVADQHFCVFEGTASTVVTTARTVFLPIKKLMHDVRVDYATFVVNTASAATDVAQLGLYTLDATGVEVLRLVTSTQVRLDFGSAGTIKKTLQNPALLRRGSIVVAGFWSSYSGAPAYPCFVSSSGPPPTGQIATASLMYLAGDSGLQPEYKTSILTGVDTRQPFPLFGYASATFDTPTATW